MNFLDRMDASWIAQFEAQWSEGGVADTGTTRFRVLSWVLSGWRLRVAETGLKPSLTKKFRCDVTHVAKRDIQNRP